MGTRVPADRYWRRDVADRETTHLWPKVWLLVAHASDVANEGSWITVDHGRFSIVVGRHEGRVTAFRNACAHRGAELCSSHRGQTAAGKLRCPYHHWEWRLDGSLASAPGAVGMELAGLRLKMLACELRAGFVFVHLDPDPEPLDAFLGPVLPLLEAYTPERLTRRGHVTLELPCNWKVSADVSNEAYHLRTLHPELCEACDVDGVSIRMLGHHSHLVVPFGRPSRETAATFPSALLIGLARQAGFDATGMSPEAFRDALARAGRARFRSDGIDVSALRDDQLVDKHQFYLFPHVQLNFGAETLDVYRHRPHPADPERCFFDVETFERLAPGQHGPAVDRQFGRSGDFDVGPVMQADLDLIPRLQRGLRSLGDAQLPLASLESPIAQMHAGLDRYLGRD